MPQRDETINEIIALTESLEQIMVRYRLLDQLPMDVTVQQLRALAVLHHFGGHSANELATALGIGATALTGLVDRLETKRYVQRHPDPTDRRIRRIELTPTGEHVFDNLEGLRKEKHSAILGRLADEDLERLLQALIPLAEAIRQDVEAERREPESDTAGSVSVDADLTDE